MADHFLPATLLNLKHSFSLADIDFEFMNNFSGINNPNDNNNNQVMGFSQENVYPDCSHGNFGNLFIPSNNTLMIQSSTEQNISNETDHNDRKRKSMDIVTPEISSANSSHQPSDNEIKNKTGRDKRVKEKGKGKDIEKPMDVVHVRARRGQATDSHSLAERARRGKINERLRCLQEIVPGCYRTVGMAGMLDEIINYVQSLQNQVEFLSMKLTAASTFHDLNWDTFVMETMQRAKAIEALKMQNIASQGIPVAQFAPLDLNFGYFPNLPNNR